jgi:hypothetical protein
MPEQTETKTPERKQNGKYWCNFCNFSSDERSDYLSHSCKEVLERGETPKPPKQTCG